MSFLGVAIFCIFSSEAVGDHVRKMQISKVPRNGFSWKNCNTKAPFNVTALSVSPDPVQMSSDMEISFEVDVLQDIGVKEEKIRTDIEAKLSISGHMVDLCQYFPVCHLDDLCSVFSQKTYQCPDMVKKLFPDCKCPLKKNKYTVTKAVQSLPDYPVSGQLEVHLTLADQNQQLACLDIQLCLGSC